MRLKILLFFMTILSITSGFVLLNTASANDNTKLISDNLYSLQVLPGAISKSTPPEIKNPDWLSAELAAMAASKKATKASSVTYSVETRGAITASLADFKSQANQTLNDSRGWSRMGISFTEISSGGSFVLVLSQDTEVPKFSPNVCSSDWSCRVGKYIIINQNRWIGATSAWNSVGGSLRDYRHMVINHESGHWLGHSVHLNCSGAGQLAPIMQQQSIDLQGCNFNPWPLDSELWSSRLGIGL